MTKIEIKRNIHSLVDSIRNKYILEQVNDILKNIVEDKKITWDSLSIAEKKSIEKGLEQLNSGEYIEYRKLKKQFPKWLRK